MGKVLGWAIAFVVAVIALWLIIGWVTTSANVVSAGNVKEQHTQVIQNWEAMVAAAENACTVQKSATTNDPSDPVLVENPVLAYEATFRRIKVEYERRMQNFFEAKIVAPSGYPTKVPYNSDWCKLAEEMNNVV